MEIYVTAAENEEVNLEFVTKEPKSILWLSSSNQSRRCPLSDINSLLKASELRGNGVCRMHSDSIPPNCSNIIPSVVIYFDTNLLFVLDMPKYIATSVTCDDTKPSVVHRCVRKAKPRLIGQRALKMPRLEKYAGEGPNLSGVLLPIVTTSEAHHNYRNLTLRLETSVGELCV